MKVEVHKNKQSKPVSIDNVINCYQKGDMYCVAYNDNGKKVIQKFPMRDDSIFRVKEYEG